MRKDHSLDHLTDAERAELEDYPIDISLYATFNPNVDHALLTSIQNRIKTLTDELFFQLLEKDTAYLGTVLFQKKISKWREVCFWPEVHKKKEVTVARANLHKIGRVLARSGPGPGAPERWSHTDIRVEYANTTTFLDKFFKKHKEDGEKPSSKLVTRICPQWKAAFRDGKGTHNHWSIPEMALRLTIFRLAQRKQPIILSLKTLRKIVK